MQLKFVKNIIILCIYKYERKGENMEEFDVIFLDDDKKTVLANIKVEYGESATFPGKHLQKSR